MRRAVQRWETPSRARPTKGAAIDGKTMCNARCRRAPGPHLGVVGHQAQTVHTQKVGSLSVGGDAQTNEIGDGHPAAGTHRHCRQDDHRRRRDPAQLAQYLIERNAEHVFTVKVISRILREDIRLIFEGLRNTRLHRAAHPGPWPHRAALHLDAAPRSSDYPHLFPASARSSSSSADGQQHRQISTDMLYGVTSDTRKPLMPRPGQPLTRNHWTIENGTCDYILDWNWDGYRWTIRTEHGPEHHRAYADPPSVPSMTVPRYRRRDHPATGAQRPPGLRLPTHDRQLTLLLSPSFRVLGGIGHICRVGDQARLRVQSAHRLIAAFILREKVQSPPSRACRLRPHISSPRLAKRALALTTNSVSRLAGA